MALTLNGTTGITSANIADGTITNADVNDVAASKLTGALPAIDGSALTGVGGGKVLQVVQVEYGTEVSSTSSSWVDTGLSASITPSSTSSKILILSTNEFSWFGNNTTTEPIMGFKLLRGGTDIKDFHANNEYYHKNEFNANNYWGTAHTSQQYLDSPSTTSSITYKFQFKVIAGQYAFQHNTKKSFVTLMEIGA